MSLCEAVPKQRTVRLHTPVLFPIKGEWASASFTKCRSTLARLTRVKVWKIKFVCKTIRKTCSNWLNRLDNPARTCASSYLPCGCGRSQKQPNFCVAAVWNSTREKNKIFFTRENWEKIRCVLQKLKYVLSYSGAGILTSFPFSEWQ